MVKLIALDEMGQFEDRTHGIRFVGGYVGNIESVEEEEKKAEAFLKDLCNKFNQKYIYPQNLDYKTVYPKSLHGSGKTFFRNMKASANSPQERVWIDLPQKEYGDYAELDRIFNQILEREISSYLKDKGFKLYIFLDPFTDGGYQEMEGVRTNIVSLEQGANLYERMAILTMYNHVFYSLDSATEQYAFHLATRTLDSNESDWEEMYEVYTNAFGVSKSAITNTSTYKTALSIMLYEKKGRYLDSKYQFNVKPINYDNANMKTTPFLYMADIVCSYIRRTFQAQFGINKETMENKVTSDGLLSMGKKSDFQMRIYDGSETKFREMVECVKNVDITGYYGKLYELEQSDEKYKKFYLQSWIPKLEEYFNNSLKSDRAYRNTFFSRMPEYYIVTNGYMGRTENAFEKGMFIAEKLCGVLEETKDYRDRNTMLFRMYDIILQGYNHRGSLGKTKECIERCEVYRSHVGLEEYVEHTLRTLVYYFNAMDYANALKAGLELEKIIKRLKEIYQECYSESNKISQEIINKEFSMGSNKLTLAGKVYSSIGQAYGFLKEYEQANKYFQRALQEFHKNSADYTITMSHLLQLFLSHNKKEEYEIYAAGYFQTTDLWEQLQNAWNRKDGGFAFFIYVKAFHVFYAKDQSLSYILEEIINKTNKKDNILAHPWELIYQNIYESILEQNNIGGKKEYEFIKEKALHCVETSDIAIKMIQIGFKIRVLDVNENHECYLRDCLDLEEMEVCRYYVDNADKMTIREFLQKTEKLLTYAYR